MTIIITDAWDSHVCTRVSLIHVSESVSVPKLCFSIVCVSVGHELTILIHITINISYVWLRAVDVKTSDDQESTCKQNLSVCAATNSSRESCSETVHDYTHFHICNHQILNITQNP